jgi:xanthine/CO dehydrogenase XdhC/CoxF family maturation factor
VVQTISVAEAARVIAQARQQGTELVTITVLAGASAGTRYVSRVPASLDGSVDQELDARAQILADIVWRSRTTVCEGDLFGELHSVADPLIIFGAGHIAVPLANLACELGFDVTVLDDREDFAQPARFAEGVRVLHLDLAEPLRDTSVSAQTFVVMLTRAHKHDFDCLRILLQQSVLPRYIGMIGSTRRVRAAFKALLQGGVSRELLAHVHAPVGIDIGAETPAEIAVSIAAELIQVRRNKRSGGSMAHDARVLERLIPEAAAQ